MCARGMCGWRGWWLDSQEGYVGSRIKQTCRMLQQEVQQQAATAALPSGTLRCPGHGPAGVSQPWLLSPPQQLAE
jgi:hypothetical protein